MNLQWRLSPKSEAGKDGISPEFDVNGEWNCVADKAVVWQLRSAEQELGTAFARSGPLHVCDLRTGK